MKPVEYFKDAKATMTANKERHLEAERQYANSVDNKRIQEIADYVNRAFEVPGQRVIFDARNHGARGMPYRTMVNSGEAVENFTPPVALIALRDIFTTTFKGDPAIQQLFTSKARGRDLENMVRSAIKNMNPRERFVFDTMATTLNNPKLRGAVEATNYIATGITPNPADFVRLERVGEVLLKVNREERLGDQHPWDQAELQKFTFKKFLNNIRGQGNYRPLSDSFESETEPALDRPQSRSSSRDDRQ